MEDKINTKDLILDVAEKMFFTIGYENSSIQDILDVTGIARGTLYYHFKNKEDILDEVISRQGQRLFSKAKMVSQDKSLSVEKRLLYTLISMMNTEVLNEQAMADSHKSENALLQIKMNKCIIDQACPLILPLIQEGIKKGIFNTDYPEESLVMILTYVNQAFDYLVDDVPQVKQRKILALDYNIQRLLGTDPQSFSIISIFKEIS